MSSLVMRHTTVGLMALALALAPTPAMAHGLQNPDLKNAISRGPLSNVTSDPTTSEQAEAASEAAEEQRSEPDPTLVPTTAATYREHATTPEDIYAMAGGCYALQSHDSNK